MHNILSLRLNFHTQPSHEKNYFHLHFNFNFMQHVRCSNDFDC